MSATLVDLASAALTKSTQANYQHAWRLFNDFAKSVNLAESEKSFPLSSHIVALFVAHLFHMNFKASSIRANLSAIAYAHRIQNLPSPTDSFFISKILKGVDVQSPGGDARYPITLPILRSILLIMPSITSGSYNRHLYSAMCVTAFYGFLRCSEMCKSPHCLQLSQLTVDPQGKCAQIQFISFKHNTTKQPFIVSLQAKADQSICPLHYIKQYLVVRGTRPGPLFCDIMGTPVPRAAFN